MSSKRVQAFTAAHARAEIEKLRRLPAAEQPHELVFVVSRAVSADTRGAARTAWGEEASCQFWAGNELDERVKRHLDLLAEFFLLPPEGARETFRHNLPFASLGALFQGREAMLARLHETMARSPAGRATANAGKAVHGLGGVGKTRLAIEYAWQHAAEYSAVLFVGAGSPADLRRNLAALCEPNVLNLPEQAVPQEEVREVAVLRWLDEQTRWLLILDNVDSEDAAAAVDTLVAHLHGGHVLLTGRLARWGAEVEPIELDVLTEEAATGFLLARTEGRRRATKEDYAHATTIARELGSLPLALEHAGAYIAERRLSLPGYLDEWHSRRDQVLAWFDPRVSHYPASVAVTWQTSFDRLSAPARRLLERLAWLGPEPIPESLLDVPAPRSSTAWARFFRRLLLRPELRDSTKALNDALVELTTYSLVTRAAEMPIFTVHRLVQDVTRRSLASDPGNGPLIEALRWMNAAFVGDPQDIRTWPTLDPLSTHARAVADFADAAGFADPTARLMNQLGLLFLNKALLGEAEPLMRRALAIDEKSFGPEHPNVAIRLNNLARWLQDTNRLGEAELLMRRALAIDERSFGPEHPKVATDLNNLAQLLQDTNRLGEAEPLMARVMTIWENSLGEHHPNVAIALNNLAALLQATNRLGEAEPLMRRALASDEKSFGTKHPNVGRDLNNLAQLLKATNRLSEAEPLMCRALAIDEESFGTEHPKVATDLNNLAQLLKATNRLGEAEPLMRRALAIDEKSFGREHPNVASRLNNLAALLQATNRLGEAEPLIRRALAIDEESFEAEHPNIARDLNNLAHLLEATNRLGEAEPLMRRALAIDEKSFGREHPNVARRLNNLALLLQATNRLGEAEPLILRALAIDEKSFGPEHPNVSRDLNNLALLLKARNRLGEAEPLLRRALAIDEKSFGPEHPEVARDLNNLAALLQATNRLGEAEPLMARVMTIFESGLGEHHPSVATALNNLAALLQATNRLGDAEPLMRRALAIDEKSFGPEHPEVAIRLNNLATLLQATNRLGDAEPMMRRALGIFLDFTRRTGHEHPSLQIAFGNYRSLLQEMGKSESEIEAAIAALAGS